MDAPDRTKTDFAEPDNPVHPPPVDDDPAEETMDAVWRDLYQVWREGKLPMPRSYTIRQAAEKTGRPRHEIYRLIRQGKIEASPGVAGPALWLIPEEEVEKLMPEPSGDQATPGPAEAPSGEPNVIFNNKI